MPTFINGLPAHVLIVHAVVVLVPLAVLGTIAVALWPAARRRYGWLVVALSAVATLSIPLATDAGESLRHRLPPTRLIDRHAELGDQLLVFVIVMSAATLAIVALHHYRARTAGSAESGDARLLGDRVLRWARPIGVTLSVLAVAAAVVSTVQVIRIGDSGARAAWAQTTYLTPPARDQRR